jgi:hypothetical protein
MSSSSWQVINVRPRCNLSTAVQGATAPAVPACGVHADTPFNSMQHSTALYRLVRVLLRLGGSAPNHQCARPKPGRLNRAGRELMGHSLGWERNRPHSLPNYGLLSISCRAPPGLAAGRGPRTSAVDLTAVPPAPTQAHARGPPHRPRGVRGTHTRRAWAAGMCDSAPLGILEAGRRSARPPVG